MYYMCNSQVTPLGFDEKYKLPVSDRENSLRKLISCLCTWVLFTITNLYIMHSQHKWYDPMLTFSVFVWFWISCFQVLHSCDSFETASFNKLNL